MDGLKFLGAHTVGSAHDRKWPMEPMPGARCAGMPRLVTACWAATVVWSAQAHRQTRCSGGSSTSTGAARGRR
jgi:hypothetical protein